MDKEIKEIGKMTYKLNKSIDNDLDIIFFLIIEMRMLKIYNDCNGKITRGIQQTQTVKKK